MASRRHVEPLNLAEAETLEALEVIDARYAERCGLERVVSAGSLSFYARSGHAFVSFCEGAPSGFALAHAVWSGERPVVQLARLAVADEADEESRAALLAAVTKSAYDAGVYDLQVVHPECDAAGARVLASQDYAPAKVTLYARALGSRGRKGE